MTRKRDGETTECTSGWSVGSSLGGETVVREFDSTEPPSVALVTAVSDLKGVDPTDLTPPLHEVVDPDALDSLFERFADSPGAEGTLELAEYGCLIQVYGDGRVEVRSDGHVR